MAEQQGTYQRQIARQQQSQYGADNAMRGPGARPQGPPPQQGGQSPVTPTGQIKPQGQASPSLGGAPAPAPSPQVQQPTAPQAPPPQAWAQQQPVQAPAPQGYQAQPMPVPQGQQAVQQALPQVMAPLYGPDQVAQMKAANRDESVNMLRQMTDQAQQAAQARGMTGGNLAAQTQSAQNQALQQAIMGNRQIDLQVDQANRNALQQGIQAGLATADSERMTAQQQANEAFRGFESQLPLAQLDLSQQQLNAAIGQQNAAQALEAWKAQSQTGLGYAGLENELERLRLGQGGDMARLQLQLGSQEREGAASRTLQQALATQGQEADMARLQAQLKGTADQQAAQNAFAAAQAQAGRDFEASQAAKALAEQQRQFDVGGARQEREFLGNQGLRGREIDQQGQLGRMGIDTQREQNRGQLGLGLLNTLVGNQQAQNTLGYQYTALQAAQQQALLRALMGGA